MDEGLPDSDEDAISTTWQFPGKKQEEPEEGEIVVESEVEDEFLRSPAPMPANEIGKGTDALMFENESAKIIITTSSTYANATDPTRLTRSNKPNSETLIKPIHTIPLSGGDEWPTSPNPIQNAKTPQTFDIGRRIDKKRRVLRSTPQSFPNTLHRQLSITFDDQPDTDV